MGFVGFLKLNGFLIVIHEYIEVMLEDGAGLSEGVIGFDAAVGPDFQLEAVVVGALAHAGVFHVVAHLGDG